MSNRINSGRCVSCDTVLLWLDEPTDRVIGDMERQLRQNLCSACLKHVMQQQYQFLKKRRKVDKFSKEKHAGRGVTTKQQVYKPIIVDHE